MNIQQLHASPVPVGDQAGARDRRILKQWERANRNNALIETLARINREAVDREPGLSRRAQHRKHHGCVKAIFRVRADVPSDLRHGLFATPGDHEALIRFSSGFREDDRRPDSHGMAIKVLPDAGGPCPAPSDAQVQDFVLADHETFPTAEPSALILLNQLLSGRAPTRIAALLRMALCHTRTLRHAFQSRKQPSSLLDVGFFSAIPYYLGDHAVKYVVAPLGRVDAGNSVSDPDGFRADLQARLEPGGASVVFAFGVDVRVCAETQPIEDPSIVWSTAEGSRRVRLAEIIIPVQDLAETGNLGENLAFSPWHALPDHQPIGKLAESRREIYRLLARHRHERNGVEPVESAQAPATYKDGRPGRFRPSYWRAPLLSRWGRWTKTWLQRLATTSWLPRIVSLLSHIGPAQRWINWSIIDYLARQTTHRPLPLSLCQPGAKAIAPAGQERYGAYVSWPGLVDRSFTGRHLPPISDAEVCALPDPTQFVPLFQRPPTGVDSGSTSTSTLFCFFAQWLTDSFLRTHPEDRQRNTSTQELDLCQIYGLGEEATYLLRSLKGGRLRSRPDAGVGELPEFLVDPKTHEVKGHFARIAFDPIHAATFGTLEPPHGRAGGLRKLLGEMPGVPRRALENDRWDLFYASGLERGSSTIVYSALNTLFLREHNRLAGELQRRYSTTDDNWLFETARNINIAKYLKIIVEDYINHIVGEGFKLRLPQGRADQSSWYRSNRITIEFNLLYRWHALVPNQFTLGGSVVQPDDFRYNNALVEQHGIEALFDAASRQPAGRLRLHNTPEFLVPAEIESIRFARRFRLAGFNAYRSRWDLKPYGSFRELTGESAGKHPIADELAQIHGQDGIDRVELPVGLLAEASCRKETKLLPPLLTAMVASDAFSHALTNPLLGANVYGPDALTDFGAAEIERFGRESRGWLGAERGLASLQQLVVDNSSKKYPARLASFDL